MCVSPLSIKRRFGNKVRIDVVPCGKCSECLKKQQNGYVVRCIEEARKKGNMWFLTLTYNDKSVPKREFIDSDSGEVVLVNSLNRADVKKWKREVRRYYKKTYNRSFPDFSFLICGEYGPRTFRPHYHGVIFGLTKTYIDYLEKYWQDNYGFTTFQPISVVSNKGRDDLACVARYVSKYCVKPQELENPLVKDGIVEKPRKLTSIGFGLPDNFDEMSEYIRYGHDLSAYHISPAVAEKINERCNYVYNGWKYGLPLYYRKKIFYEVGINQNLVSSPLAKVCCTTSRVYSIEDTNRELRKLVSGKTDREVEKAVSRYYQSKNDSLESRRNVAYEDIKRSYQSSKF